MSVDRAPAVLARALVVLGAVLVLLAAVRVDPAAVLVLVVGVGLALTRPADVGAWVALPAAAWVLVGGGPPSLGAALLGAAGAYLVHTGTAATAVVPWRARVSPAVARRWGARCLPAAVVTLVVAVVDAVVGPTPRSALFVVGAAALVLLAAGSLVRLLAAVGAGDAVDPAN